MALSKARLLKHDFPVHGNMLIRQLKDFQSPFSQERQASLLRTFMSDPGSERKSTDLRAGGENMILNDCVRVLFGPCFPCWSFN